MYLVVLPNDMSKSKVLPNFIVQPLLSKPQKQVGKFTEVSLGKVKVWLRSQDK